MRACDGTSRLKPQCRKSELCCVLQALGKNIIDDAMRNTMPEQSACIELSRPSSLGGIIMLHVDWLANIQPMAGAQMILSERVALGLDLDELILGDNRPQSGFMASGCSRQTYNPCSGFVQRIYLLILTPSS